MQHAQESGSRRHVSCLVSSGILPGPFSCAGLPSPAVIAHYRGENGRKFVVEKQTNCTKLQALNKTLHKIAHKISIDRESSEPRRRHRRLARTQLRTYERQNHARTNVRRDHQARTHVRTPEESTKRTVHIQQWGSHPLSLAGWQGPAKRK